MPLMRHSKKQRIWAKHVFARLEAENIARTGKTRRITITAEIENDQIGERTSRGKESILLNHAR